MPLSPRWKRYRHSSSSNNNDADSIANTLAARQKKVGFTSIAETESESSQSDRSRHQYPPAPSSSSSSNQPSHASTASPLQDMMKNTPHDSDRRSRSYDDYQTNNSEMSVDDEMNVLHLASSSHTDSSLLSVLTPPEHPQSTSWWMNLLSKLQLQYQTENEKLKQNLQITETKKSLYKSELRQNIAVQLAWLEDRMTSPRHVLPASSFSSGASENNSNNNNRGVEVTLTDAQHVQRLLELEETLEETTNLYEKTTRQHRNELTDHQKQRRAWKEKIRVLSDLLNLTEQQHASEKASCEAQMETLEQSMANLIADKNELVAQSEQLEKENEHLREQLGRTNTCYETKVAEYNAEVPTLKDTVKHLEAQKAALQGQVETLKVEKESLGRTWQAQLDKVRNEKDRQISEQRFQIETLKSQLKEQQVKVDSLEPEIATLQHELDVTRSGGASILSSSTTVSLIQEQLDRATAERDFYKQELDQLDRTNIMASYQESVKKHMELVGRLKKLEEKHKVDQLNYHVQIDTKSNELETALLEKQVLEEALETQANEHSRELVALKNKIIEYESVRKSRESKHVSEMDELEQRLRLVEKERDQAVDDVEMMERSQNEKSMQHISDLSEQHARHEQEWTEKLEQLQRVHEGKLRELSVYLSEYKTLHSRAVKKYEHLLSEKNNLQRELDKLRNAQMGEEKHRIEMQQKAVLESIEQLRNEFFEVRETLDRSQSEQKTETAKFEELRQDLTNIQHSLNVAVAELTLEADALLESRDAIKTATSDLSNDESIKSRVLQQQERLLKEIDGLRDSMSTALSVRPTNELSRELVDELQRKEASLAIAETELRHIQEKLEAEIASRQTAEAEIEHLTELGDASLEQVMYLQSANTHLTQKLRLAGLQVDAALTAQIPSGYCMSPTRGFRKRRDDDSIPELEQALALANDIRNIVNGEGGTAMEMLQSMEDVMDIHEKNSQDSLTTPQPRENNVLDDNSGIDVVREVLFSESDEPPMPVETPMQVLEPATTNVRTLQLVVEQLYGRCQLLERERTELMESTLDLLEKARDASAAELEAAVATARRRATEEILAIQLKNRADEERIFQRLCRECVSKKES